MQHKSKNNVYTLLFYILGVFSTIQIIEIFNITAFTVILILVFVIFVFTHKINYSQSRDIIFYLILCCLTNIFSLFNTDSDSRYLYSSFTGLINTVLVCVLPMMVNNKNESIAFIKGFRLSCYIQIIWCFLQIILFELSSKDLNNLVFGEILKMDGDLSSYRDGKLVCTGLHWHPANLIPIVLFIYFYDKTVISKILCAVVVYYSKSTTLTIAFVLCVLYSIYKIASKAICSPNGTKIKQQYIILIIIALIIILLNNSIVKKIGEAIEMLITRFMQITSTVGGTSSAVHFSYYTQIPKIYSQVSLLTWFFGVGMSSSGAIFSNLFGQYTDMVWVVESDYVNILLSQGIIGFCVFYYVMLKRAFRVKKKSSTWFAFYCIIIICGITYNLQFYWVILLELMICKDFNLQKLRKVGNGCGLNCRNRYL